MALADNGTVVTLSLSDEDFGKLVSGKTQAQRLFMSGKLKVKGDVMKVRYIASPHCASYEFIRPTADLLARRRRWSLSSRRRRRRQSCR